jgi:transcriptional regulator with XRE-family HTH domain
MSKTLEFLAEELKNRRKQAGLSQEELSEQTGVSMALISEIERGIANPTVTSLEKIAEYFRVSVAELLNIDDALNSAARIRSDIYANLTTMDAIQLKKVLSLIQSVRSK